MYKLVGIRRNGNSVDKTYDNLNVARFEFEAISLVAKQLTLYHEDKVIDSFEMVETVDLKYIIEGESAFSDIKKIFRNRQDAFKYFRLNKDRCNWLALYESKDDNLNQLDLYIYSKGA